MIEFSPTGSAIFFFELFSDIDMKILFCLFSEFSFLSFRLLPFLMKLEKGSHSFIDRTDFIVPFKLNMKRVC